MHTARTLMNYERWFGTHMEEDIHAQIINNGPSNDELSNICELVWFSLGVLHFHSNLSFSVYVSGIRSVGLTRVMWQRCCTSAKQSFWLDSLHITLPSSRNFLVIDTLLVSILWPLQVANAVWKWTKFMIDICAYVFTASTTHGEWWIKWHLMPSNCHLDLFRKCKRRRPLSYLSIVCNKRSNESEHVCNVHPGIGGKVHVKNRKLQIIFAQYLKKNHFCFLAIISFYILLGRSLPSARLQIIASIWVSGQKRWAWQQPRKMN